MDHSLIWEPFSDYSPLPKILYTYCVVNKKKSKMIIINNVMIVLVFELVLLPSPTEIF